MRTPAEILAAASDVTTAELEGLAQGVRDLARSRRALRMTVDGREYRMSRLTDQEAADLGRHSIAIEQDLLFLIELHRHQQRTREAWLDFPRIDAILTHLTGPSGGFDQWKSSYRFVFRLEFATGNTTASYLFVVYNCRDSAYFDFRKVVSEDDERLKNPVYYEPVNSEFSLAQMRSFVLHFQGYLLGRLEAAGTAGLTPFVRTVPAGGIVYGLCDGVFFEEQYEVEEQRRMAESNYRKRIEGESDPRPTVIGG